MRKCKIYLNDFNKVRSFIGIADHLDCKLKLSSGGYAVDGKSILGIFTLDLSQAIEVSIVNDKPDPEICLKELESFMIS